MILDAITAADVVFHAEASRSVTECGRSLAASTRLRHDQARLFARPCRVCFTARRRHHEHAYHQLTIQETAAA